MIFTQSCSKTEDRTMLNDGTALTTCYITGAKPESPIVHLQQEMHFERSLHWQPKPHLENQEVISVYEPFTFRCLSFHYYTLY